MTKKRVVLVVESPFSARDEARFGVQELETAGFLVEVWDICDLTLPLARDQWIGPPGLPHVYRCTSWPQVEELAKGLKSSDAVVLLCGVYWRLDLAYAPLLKAVLASPAVVGALAGGTIPPPLGLVRLRGRLHQAFLNLQSRTRPAFRVPRALDVVWAGTTVESIAPTLLSRDTDRRYVHTLDYDLILGLPQRPERQVPFVVYLDSMGPYHPDFASLGLENPWSEASYREFMQSVFESVETSGFQVVVAAHPRAEAGGLDQLYPGRDIRHGATPELIQQCAYALTVEGSTSLGMAAVLKKPVLFVEDPAVPESSRVLAEQFRKALGAIAARPRGRRGDWDTPRVDLSRYRQYVEKYVKRSSTPEVKFWDFVATDLKGR